MGDILFIVNPIAGGGKSKGFVSLIKEIMDESKRKYEIIVTEKPKEAIRLASHGSMKGYETIVAVGGDGTINEVALGILSTGAGTLGIIPGGTGNDLARTLNIPNDPKKAIETILKGHKKKIDVGFANDNMFLNIASIGLDSEIVKNTEKIKTKIKGRFAYFIGALNTLFKYRNKEVNIQLDNIIIDEEIMLLAVSNGKYYGGGFKICPMAVIEDGYFHICIVKKVPKIKLLLFFPLFFRGTHTKIKKNVEIYKAKEIKVKTSEKTDLNIDGEIFEVYGEAVFSIGDKGIDVACE
ncbi:diacylglycerol/lipid kinase family protein [Anaerosalibacter massiliensis]|uniref:Diacylglycerol kinase family lipid kinase n=1 Tax=Anaerosalibacter massiliensis TaxID=1347392 RepID=A0A9X2MKV8_9FIRM|nr:diacylglycerol kinase family protein [Anaerosalibacter massiliensis]MCR2045469.1 diacylglycerol kinase family lipid kinase [Anaerosalibacter massiliensis]